MTFSSFSFSNISYLLYLIILLLVLTGHSNCKKDKCLNYDQDDNCIKCQSKYYLDDKNNCRACPEGCESCDKNQCKSCLPKYFKEEKSCLSCPNSCLICFTKSTCSKCEVGTKLIGGTCINKNQENKIVWLTYLLIAGSLMIFLHFIYKFCNFCSDENLFKYEIL